MDYSKISYTANRLSGLSGPVIFIFSGVGVSFNYYIPAMIPPEVVSGMIWVILMSVLFMGMSWVQYIKNPHYAVGEKCPKCQKPVVYTGVKCSNTTCDYKVKFH